MLNADDFATVVTMTWQWSEWCAVTLWQNHWHLHQNHNHNHHKHQPSLASNSTWFVMRRGRSTYLTFGHKHSTIMKQLKLLNWVCENICFHLLTNVGTVKNWESFKQSNLWFYFPAALRPMLPSRNPRRSILPPAHMTQTVLSNQVLTDKTYWQGSTAFEQTTMQMTCCI